MQKSTAITRSTRQKGNSSKENLSAKDAEQGPGLEKRICSVAGTGPVKVKNTTGSNKSGFHFLSSRSHRCWRLHVFGCMCMIQDGTKERSGLCFTPNVTIFSDLQDLGSTRLSWVRMKKIFVGQMSSK